jgi:SWI/SNF-related matrix-associated actin-dependent regulator of chromatin subfamily A member 5
VRKDIAEHTKPKRDAFLLDHKDLFLPLLPSTNYINKLARQQEAKLPPVVPYRSLTVQPEGVLATMKPYQLEGLSFLVHMHENGMPAILGDEMGLGKTLQTLSLFQYLKENKVTTGEHRPYLVICPLSVLSSWLAEAKRWVPHMKTVRFHGPKGERDRLKKDTLLGNVQYDIYVATYESFRAEHSWFKSAFVWRYCVLDEGHKVKNSESDVSHTLHGLGAEYRLLLTGTPVQNNLFEMWSLLYWLLPEVFTADTAANFKNAFDLSQGKASTSFMDHARRLLEVIMLRRLKASDGVNLGLPPKEEVLLYVPITPMQRFWYERLLTRSDKATLDGLFSNSRFKEEKAREDERTDGSMALLERAADLADEANANSMNVWAESQAILEQALETEAEHDKGSWKKLMNLLMQLRKVCTHPYVLKEAAPPEYLLGEHVITASGKFIVLSKLVDELVVNQGKKVLIFSGFTGTLNLCEDLLVYKGANGDNPRFRYTRLDGGTSRARRNLGMRQFNDANSNFQIMLLSTRAGGLGINLTSATEVVFLDEDWNPQVTIQAEARAHRIGQTKKVTIYKLCSQGTVEEQMMGRIRKKLYLSAKITEGMRNIHTEESVSKKRKRQSINPAAKDDAPQLTTASLQVLIRRGAQTLARPAVDAAEMLLWDWPTILMNCKDKPLDALITDEEVDEQAWLNTMERVECAVFEGRKHHKEIDTKIKAEVLNRADRREGKNTTVMMNGFMINKESLLCADWEAVPTLAGKDPRLAEPKRAKRKAIEHQDYCQTCFDGGDVVVCGGCPRVYHIPCLDKDFRTKAQGMSFYCPQHQCHDCSAKTGDAGGLIYACRWCENGFCEDCLDWSSTKLLGDRLPEYDILGFQYNGNAHYVECSHCVENWARDPQARQFVDEERSRVQTEYDFVHDHLAVEAEQAIKVEPGDSELTPITISEVTTPTADVALGIKV